MNDREIEAYWALCDAVMPYLLEELDRHAGRPAPERHTLHA